MERPDLLKDESIMKRVLTRLICAATILVSLLPAAAQACDASGHWTAVQSNGGRVEFDLSQNGLVLGGTAYSPGIGNGSVSGSFRGETIDFDIYWPNGSVGTYSGRVGGDGRIHHGFTHDRRNPGSRASWYSTSPLDCSDE
jgi:hypothetical protein